MGRWDKMGAGPSRASAIGRTSQIRIANYERLAALRRVGDPDATRV